MNRLMLAIVVASLAGPAFAYEDFSDVSWIKVEGSGCTIDKGVTNAYTVSWLDVDRDGDSYCYKDYTVDHFGTTLTHQFEINVTAYTGGGMVGYWMLANEIDDWKGIQDGGAESDDFVLLSVYSIGISLSIVEDGVTVDFTASYNLVQGANNYVTVERAGNDWTLTVRQTSHTGTILKQETITGTESNTFRYLYTCQSYNSGLSGKDMDGYTKNLNLHESSGGGEAVNMWWGRRRQ